jgi:hypothetical protein
MCAARAAFLLNHSRSYHIAIAAGLAEFVLEAFLVPSLKEHSLTFALGCLVVAIGQARCAPAALVPR